MFGAAVGVRRETHFSFPTLADASPPLVKAVCKIVSRLAMLVLGLGLAWFGLVLAANSWSVPMAGAPLGVGLRFAPVAVGGA
jgi:TRAP-type C4-dicarboxylate transport system permease small subunit